jgi:GNAT superfamily N-acetyltransferase
MTMIRILLRARVELQEMDVARVRAAHDQDAAVLPELERSAAQVFGEIADLAWVADGDVQSSETHRTLARAGSAWVIVNQADQPFGFLSAELCGAELHIWELAVRRERQGQGAGRALLEAAFAYARRHGLGAVTLTTFREVPWNEPLYAHFGFTTLDAAQLGARLSQILEREAASGLPTDRRCAMRLNLSA